MNLAEIYKASRNRAEKQHAIENAIDKFTPDYVEASEIIAAVVGQLRHRYDNLLGVDLEHCFRELFDALDEADMTQPRTPDPMERTAYEADMMEQEEWLKGMRVNDE